MMQSEIQQAKTLVKKEEILEFLFENAISRPVPMNEYLKQFNESNLKGIVGVLREFEKNKWVQCNGNYAWLGSLHTGERLDLSHPLTQFTCKLLPAGVEYMQQKHEENPVVPPPPPPETFTKYIPHQREELAVSPVPYQVGSEKIPWYQHWVFWLVCVVLLMGAMIALVEMKS